MKYNDLEKEALLKKVKALIHTQEAQEYMRIRHTKSDYVTPLLLRWNTEGEVVMSLKAIGDVVGVTPGAIRNIERRYCLGIGYRLLGLSVDEAIEKIKAETKVWVDHWNNKRAKIKKNAPKSILKKLEDDDRIELIKSLNDANVYLCKILDCFTRKSDEYIQLKKASKVIRQLLEDCK